ncbi:MAG: ribosome silencing factor [Propionibacteriaceae bacterium]|nr:ribosome silencing factor [Propionibacteriaceae bacterium]
MSASQTAIDLTDLAARAAADKLADDILAIDVSERLAITDVFLILTGHSDRQVLAIRDAVEERLLAAGVKAVRREGDREARWILLDFLDLVVHVQQADTRRLFALDRLWHDCPTLDLTLPQAPAAQVTPVVQVAV